MNLVLGKVFLILFLCYLAWNAGETEEKMLIVLRPWTMDFGHLSPIWALRLSWRDTQVYFWAVLQFWSTFMAKEASATLGDCIKMSQWKSKNSVSMW